MTKQEQEAIYHQWILEYKPLLFKVLRTYTNTRADENDLFQEIVIQVWQSIRGFKKQSSVHTWIYRVSLNTAIKWSGRNKNKEYQEIRETTSVIVPQNPSNEKLDWLYSEIQQLNTIEKSLTLLLLDGFSYQEMSEILGISVSNVGVKINRIKKRLKERSKLIYQ
ncbi:MAG: RNA polymerase sigma factor [Bacteroidota bacterium]